MPITRLSLDGYGAKRAGSFAGKEASVVVEEEVVAEVAGGGKTYWPGYIPPRKKKKKEEVVVEVAVEQVKDERIVKYVEVKSQPLSVVSPSNAHIIEQIQPLIKLLENNAIRSRIVKQKIEELEEEEDIKAIVRLLQ